MRYINKNSWILLLGAVVTAMLLINIIVGVFSRQLQNKITAEAQLAAEQLEEALPREVAEEDIDEALYYWQDEDYMFELEALATTLAIDRALLDKSFPARHNYVSSILWESQNVEEEARLLKTMTSSDFYRNYCEYFFISLNNKSEFDWDIVKSGYVTENEEISSLTEEDLERLLAEEEDGYSKYLIEEKLNGFPVLTEMIRFQNHWGTDTLAYVVDRPFNRRAIVIFDVYADGTLNDFNVYNY